MVVVALGLFPAFLILRFWNGPAKTLSERIQGRTSMTGGSGADRKFEGMNARS